LPERSSEAGQLDVTGTVKVYDVSRILGAPFFSSKFHVVDLSIDGSIKAHSSSTEISFGQEEIDKVTRSMLSVQINRDA
jgi:hypothetical protein